MHHPNYIILHTVSLQTVTLIYYNVGKKHFPGGRLWLLAWRHDQQHLWTQIWGSAAHPMDGARESLWQFIYHVSFAHAYCASRVVFISVRWHQRASKTIYILRKYCLYTTWVLRMRICVLRFKDRVHICWVMLQSASTTIYMLRKYCACAVRVWTLGSFLPIRWRAP
jgi:hypothetical protein